MKFKLTLEGRVKDVAIIIEKTKFLVANDAVILAAEVDKTNASFDTSRPYLGTTLDISSVNKRGNLTEGALTLSPSRQMDISEFTLSSFTLLETRYIGNQTELILEDDTYLSVFTRTMIEIGALSHIMIGGYRIAPYENIRIFKDSVVFLKETNHFLNILK